MAAERLRFADEAEPKEGRSLGQLWHADRLRLEAAHLDGIAEEIEMGGSGE